MLRFWYLLLFRKSSQAKAAKDESWLTVTIAQDAHMPCNFHERGQSLNALTSAQVRSRCYVLTSYQAVVAAPSKCMSTCRNRRGTLCRDPCSTSMSDTSPTCPAVDNKVVLEIPKELVMRGWVWNRSRGIAIDNRKYCLSTKSDQENGH